MGGSTIESTVGKVDYGYIYTPACFHTVHVLFAMDFLMAADP